MVSKVSKHLSSKNAISSVSTFLKWYVNFDKIGSENIAETIKHLGNSETQCLDFSAIILKSLSVSKHISLSSMNHIIPKLAQTTLIYEMTFWHWHWLNRVSLSPTHSITPGVLFFIITVVLNTWRLTSEKVFWFSTSLKNIPPYCCLLEKAFPDVWIKLHYRSPTLSLYHVIVIILFCPWNSLKEI